MADVQRAQSSPVPALLALPTDALVNALGFLDVCDLGLGVMLTCKALKVVGDHDHAWLPAARRIVAERLILNESIVERIARINHGPLRVCPAANFQERVAEVFEERRGRYFSEARRASQPSAEHPLPPKASSSVAGNCRAALHDAFEDARRCELTNEELCRFRWHMRFVFFEEMRGMIDAESLLPGDLSPPIFVRFNENHVVETEPHEAIGQWRNAWEHVPRHRGMIPVRTAEDRPSFSLAPPDGRPRRFSCLHWRGRPPLRVWRHRKNWHIIMTHIHLQYASYVMDPPGSDPVLDNDRAYIHPWVLGLDMDQVPSDSDDAAA